MKTVEELEQEIKEIENKVNSTINDYQDAMKSHVENMEKILEELKKNENTNTFEPTPKSWTPKDGEDYYFVNPRFGINCYTYSQYSDHDKEIVKYNRVFKTFDECKFCCRIQKAFRDASREFNVGVSNYFLNYDYINKRLSALRSYNSKREMLYFSDKKTIENLINEFGEENVKRYYLGVY